MHADEERIHGDVGSLFLHLRTLQTMDKNKYRHQHRVSKFHLRHFLAEGQYKLVQYEKVTATNSLISPKNATVIDYAFSSQDDNGQWDHSYEHNFSEVETEAAKAIKKIVDHQILNKHERISLAKYIIIAIYRSSNIKDFLEDIFRNYPSNKAINFLNNTGFRDKIRQLYNIDNESTLDTFIEYGRSVILRGNIYPINMPNNFYLKNTFKIIQEAELLSNLSWSFFMPSKNKYFVLSDNPVIVRRKNYNYDPYYWGLLRSDINAEVTMPLTKDFILVCAKKMDNNKYFIASTKRTDDLVERTIISANKHIFAPTESQWIHDIIKQVRSFKVLPFDPASL